jgi:fructose-1,6-bisphosphatase/inositol monophosphatase family enzyme
MHEIAKKDKLVYFKFLNYLPKKINKLYFGKLEGKFKLNNKSKKKFDPVTNIDRTLEIFLRTEISKKFPNDGIIGEEFKVKKQKVAFLGQLTQLMEQDLLL